MIDCKMIILSNNKHNFRGDMNELKRKRMNYLQPKIHIFKSI